MSMRWDGTDRKAQLKVTGYQSPNAGPNAQPTQATELLVSPDGNRVLASVNNRIFVVPLSLTGGATPSISVQQPTGAALPFRRMSRLGGEFMGWSSDSRSVFYSLGRAFFQYDLTSADSLAADSASKAPARPEGRGNGGGGGAAGAASGPNAPVYEPTRTDITVTAAKDRPTGSVVLLGARIITMKGDPVIARGDVVVTNNRIAGVGEHGSVPVPADAKIIDVSGKTIMPVQDDITSADDAIDVMRRYSEFYRTETSKQYMAGDRRQRQWIAMAARAQQITPTQEVGLDFKKNMTEAMDGYAGSEHTLPIVPMYKDAIGLFAQSGTTWTPTLLVQYGGRWAENWWYEHYDIFADRKLTRFTPFSELERRGLRRPQWFHESENSFKLFAEQAKKLVEAGGRVGLGGHGQLQGLGVHWELWSIASGGMKAMDAFRVGTIFGAEALGLQQHLGSVEAGKLADLLVLDFNPLDDIRNTNTISLVMKNGRLYDGDTLAEVWPRAKALLRQWWMANDALPAAATPK